jgi:hypothetical protein
LPKVGGLILDIPGPVLGSSMVIFLGILFAMGITLATSGGLGFRSGLMVGLSLCVGIVAENHLLFADAIPASLAPFLSNGIATGGVAAVLLAALFRYYPGAAASMRLPLELLQLPLLTSRVAELEHSIGLPPRQVPVVQLVSEELFNHLCQRRHEVPGAQARFFWTNVDEGVRVEVESEIDFTLEPATKKLELSATDLDRLGLRIVSRLAHTVRVSRIDGHSYVELMLRDR